MRERRCAFALLVVALSALAQNPVDWKALEPEINRLFLSHHVSGHHENTVDVSKTATLKSGLQVALVDLGGAGASTDAIAVIYVQAGRPFVGRLRERNGVVSDSGDILLDGASVTHSDHVDIDAAEDAIVHTRVMAPEGRVPHQCGVEAYRWNPVAKLFEWNASLSSSLVRTYCVRSAN